MLRDVKKKKREKKRKGGGGQGPKKETIGNTDERVDGVGESRRKVLA